ncbi:putative tyrosinase [Podospora australis]|uniref:Tyrosinase n=1 Tax=Podospora australis TaxID=1536484 RepID=A0AAN6WK62_9PEZI|nr:putative tyrosinase [Podospora australis]
MKVSTSLLGGVLASTAFAAPGHGFPSVPTCTSPVIRKEFRNLSTTEKASFLGAVKCLMALPPKLNATYPASTSRYEDFLVVHQENTPRVHWAPMFLPWHRGFLQDFEDALRDECSYTGGLPYWNTALDFADISASPLLNGNLSFGGDGVGDFVPPEGPSSGGNCLANGFFHDTRIHIAQGPAPAVSDDRCILRYFKPFISAFWFAPDKVATIMASPNYTTFEPAVEGDMNPLNPFPTMGLHTGGHAAIGGDMSDMFTSNADPIFYPFHANLDRLWAKWQAVDPTNRQYQVGGAIAPRGVLNMWPTAPAGDMTLDYVLEPLKVKASSSFTTVGQMMNTKGKGVRPAPGKPRGVLCYEYQE